MPAPAPALGARLRRRAGRRPGRIVWRRRLAPALAACALSVDALGDQDFDVRPIYYAMLEAAESSFSSHSGRMEEDFRATRSALSQSAARNLERLRAEGEELERARREGEAAFEVERDALNVRVEALNRRVRHRELDREAAAGAVERYREAFDRVLAELRAAQSRYRELAKQVQERRSALEDASRTYRDGSSEEAREIARLDEAYRRFTAQVVGAYREREEALRLEKEAHRSWLEEGMERRQDGQRALAALAERYAALKDVHDRVQQELNRRIEAYNEQVRAQTDEDAGESGLAVLRDAVARHRELLDGHRRQAVALVREITGLRAGLGTERAAFEEERVEREEALRAGARALVAEQQEIAALVEARRADVQERIRAVESRVRAGIAALREQVKAGEGRIAGEFGAAPAELLAAAAQWTRTLDPSHLYAPEGAPLFDLAPSGSAVLYDAIGAARDLESGMRRALDRHLSAVRKPVDDIVAEREALVLRHRDSASALAERSADWRTRLEAAERESRRVSSALAEYFEGRIALAGLDLRALQAALLDVLEAPVPAHPESGERERLRDAVAGKAAMLGAVIDTPPVSAHPLVEGLAETGRERLAEPQGLEWQRLGGESFHRESAPEEQPLAGESERRLLSAWYRRLDTAGALDPFAHRLAHHFPSLSAPEVEDALFGLFDAGMREAGEVVRYRWKEGLTAYQIRILERSYWLQPDGRLLLSPLTW